MYCVKCGVELADTEKQCPLCKTRVYHPDLQQGAGEPLYPKEKFPAKERRSKLPQALATAAFLLPMAIAVIWDKQINGIFGWSGYVIGALLTLYVGLVLPGWFRKPNPVIFFPCFVVAMGLYLLYIDLVTGGGWFLSFAFPVLGGVGAIATAVVTLVHYLRHGKLYIFGGMFVALGAFMLLVEFLMDITFPSFSFMGWSLYPLAGLVIIGGFLIFLAICRPARETVERKVFI